LYRQYRYQYGNETNNTIYEKIQELEDSMRRAEYTRSKIYNLLNYTKYNKKNIENNYDNIWNLERAIRSSQELNYTESNLVDNLESLSYDNRRKDRVMDATQAMIYRLDYTKNLILSIRNETQYLNETEIDNEIVKRIESKTKDEYYHDNRLQDDLRYYLNNMNGRNGSNDTNSTYW